MSDTASRTAAHAAPRTSLDAPEVTHAPATDFAATLIASLVAHGVRDLVVCPGSRSQALALAAAEAERLDLVRLHVRTDERAAAFFALGVARETGLPAPVIVTSGTAVANLMPAALEAHEARVPLMLLTADRPAEAHGVRTSQTTRQAGLFDRFARYSVETAPPTVSESGEVIVAGVERVRALIERVHAVRTPAHASAGFTPEVLAERALAAALGGPGAVPAGPVQLNLAFREPLSGAGSLARFFDPARATPTAGVGQNGRAEPGNVRHAGDPDETASSSVDRVSETAADGATPDMHIHHGDSLAVVIAGEGAGPEAEQFAHRAGLPLLAEVVSGSRFGREAITAYATLIDDPRVGGLTEQAIVFGHPTLTRQVPALLSRDDVEVIVVDPYAEAAGDESASIAARIDSFNPGKRARIVRAARVADQHDPRVVRRWLGAWVVPDRELRESRSTVHQPDLQAATATGYKARSAYARAEVEVMRERVSRELLVESVWRATWPHDRLVIAASRLVRVLDGLAQPRNVDVHANRGLAGIDGTIATGMGIAVTSQSRESEQLSAGTTRVLLGDLALLHDVGSLQLTDGEMRPRIQLIVGNDGGGTIFDKLEVADRAATAAFDRVMFTPHSVDLAPLAAAYGWEYTKVSTRAELERLFTVPVTGPGIVEVPLRR